MNPAHLKLQPHRIDQLEGGGKRWRIAQKEEKKNAPIWFAMDYMKALDADGEGRSGQERRAAEASEAAMPVPIEVCEVCGWPVRQCACYKGDQVNDLTECGESC